MSPEKKFFLAGERGDNSSNASIELMSPVEIITQRIECKRSERIPLNDVITENALIDPSHADELGASMKQKRGQISPIAVRARLSGDDGNNVYYDIIDGFHRAEGKKRSGDIEIDATVIYGCSDQELYDLRILAASSVRSVQFARIVEWISRSWETTSWSKEGLSVTQAFGMAVSDARRSNVADLSSEEVKELKDWVEVKAQRWNRTVGATYQMLRLVSNADPTLVRQVRTQGGGKDRVAHITPARLKMVVDQFPGEENYPMQRALLGVTVDQRYYTEELCQLIERVKLLIKPGMTEGEIYDLAKEIPVGQTVDKHQSRKSQIKVGKAGQISERGKIEEKDDEEVGHDDWDEWDELEPSDEDLELIDEASSRGTEVPDAGLKVSEREELRFIRENVAGDKIKKAAFARGDRNDVLYLRKRVIDLEAALGVATKNLTSSELWWQTAVYLTPRERTCMQRFMYENHPFVELAASLGLTTLQALLEVKSAFYKRYLSEPQRRA